MSNRFSRESFLAAAQQLKIEIVELSGGSFRIRELSAGKASELSQKVQTDDKQAMVLWFIASVIDDDGNLMFSEEDIPALTNSGASYVLKVGSAAVKLTGLTADPKENAKN